MRRLVLVLLLVAGILVWRASAPEFYLGGIQVNEADKKVWVSALERAGFNTVAVTAYAKQGDWDSSNLWFDEPDPWLLEEIRQARRRGLKVVLVLRVALDHAFERNKFLWHGMIMPRGPDPMEEWFDRYERFVTEWAAMAEEEGIDMLGIGSELNSMTSTSPLSELPSLEEYWINEEKTRVENERLLEHASAVETRHLSVRGFDNYETLSGYLEDDTAAHRQWARQVTLAGVEDPVSEINARRASIEARWRQLIVAVREIYGGELTYAANFDQYEQVGFWDELDVIGINAYFPLRDRWEPALSEDELFGRLKEGWRAVLTDIEEFRRANELQRKRVVFTELGYVARANSTIEPWAAHGFSVLPTDAGEALVVWEDQPEDRQERALAVRALFDVSREPATAKLEGLLYWKLSSVPAHREVEPFVLILEKEDEDPLLPELRRFTARRPLDRFRRWVEGLGAG